ncbi:MAG: peptidoglycan DD-metalloendopeptidase family protein [Pseudomonadales bacterium]
MSLRNFPRLHLKLAGTLGLSLLAVAAILPDADALPTAAARSFPAPSFPDASRPDILGAALFDVGALPRPGWSPPKLPDTAFDAALLAETRDPQEPPESAAAHLRRATVRSGDSLAALFKREGLSAVDLHHIVASKPYGARLKNIRPGDQLTFEMSAEGVLNTLAYQQSPLERLVFSRDDNGFSGQALTREADRVQAFKAGQIRASLFLAGQEAGFDDAMTLRLAQIFQWDIDFVLDIRRGDEFAALFEELYLDGKFIGYGDILAAEFVNQGRTYKAIRYTTRAGDTHYFTPNGEPMRQAFLRAPVEFSRISSNFNMNRRHPLFNRSMPHRGIDYSAPVGTPILSAGDGRVVTASRTAPNGNYLVVQHGTQITTKYLHLHRFGQGIKQGVRVKQGQVIGYVGATGWATGPHLHYEFVVNGVHQNPRTVKLPRGEPIPRGEMARFKAESAPLLAQLADQRQERQLALAD